jgi:hypothetical protein
MNIRETDAIFNGRKVIQVDEIFFVDSELGTPSEDGWVSDLRIAVIYKGCIYNRVDDTWEFRAARQRTQEVLEASPVLDCVLVEDVTLSEDEARESACSHAV